MIPALVLAAGLTLTVLAARAHLRWLRRTYGRQ